MVILLVGFKMLVEFIDLLGQHSDLDRCGTSVLRMGLETVDDFCFLFLKLNQLTTLLVKSPAFLAETRNQSALLLFYL